MNGVHLGLVALIFGGVVAVWKLLGWLSERLWLIALAGGGAYYVIRLVVEIASEVFSLRGLLWSIGLSEPAGLQFPGVVRAVTLAGLFEIAVAVSLVTDHRRPTGERRSWSFGYLVAHLTLLWRLLKAVMAVVPLVRDGLVAAKELGEDLLEQALERFDDLSADSPAPGQDPDDEISDEDWRYGPAGQAV